jgi:hypothetical protein
MTDSACADVVERGAKAAPTHAEMAKSIRFQRRRQHQGESR